MIFAVEKLNVLLWTYVIPTLLVMLSVYMTIALKGLPIRKMFSGIKLLKKKNLDEEGSVSPFAAFSMAMAATVGTGNIVGVMVALKGGGPGALFWMWIVGILGMSLKYSEVAISVKYRVKAEDNEYFGGPMFYLEKGVGSKGLAKFFAMTGILTILFGMGTFPQVHSIVEVFDNTFQTPVLPTAIILTLVTAYITLGGIKSIARISMIVVPFIIILFLTGGLIIIFTNYFKIIPAFKLIITSAFGMSQAMSGILGYAIKEAIQQGTRRGVFSNESGLGSAPMAASCARTPSPKDQGIIHILEVVIDTLIINTVVGLIIVMSRAYTFTGNDVADLYKAFSTSYGLGNVTLTIGIVFFAFTTIIAWNFYGTRCAYYLFGTNGVKVFRFIYIFIVLISSFVKWPTVWTLADMASALMILPNILGLFLLRKEIIELSE